MSSFAVGVCVRTRAWVRVCGMSEMSAGLYMRNVTLHFIVLFVFLFPSVLLTTNFTVS